MKIGPILVLLEIQTQWDQSGHSIDSTGDVRVFVIDKWPYSEDKDPELELNTNEVAQTISSNISSNFIYDDSPRLNMRGIYLTSAEASAKLFSASDCDYPMAPPGISSSTEVRPQTRMSEDDTFESSGSLALGQRDIVVLDGGFATQLSCHVQAQIDGDVLWSARFLATDPEAVIDTHLDFLRAGADLIITNTYQADVGLFVKHLNVNAEQAYQLIKDAVDMAKVAVERFLEEFPNASRPKVVGSVGPYGASLHDGSEYSGSYAKHTTMETLKSWHTPRIKALVEGGVDLLALETIPCKIEAEMLVNLLREFPGTKAWLSFSVNQDGKSTAYGENFQEVARYCYDLNPSQIVAVGVNCTAPSLIESLISGINAGRSRPIPLIVYPNSGESYNVEQGWINRDKCEPVETFVRKWLDLGVSWVGGCCRTYAMDITRIRREVELWKQERQ